ELFPRILGLLPRRRTRPGVLKKFNEPASGRICGRAHCPGIDRGKRSSVNQAKGAIMSNLLSNHPRWGRRQMLASPAVVAVKVMIENAGMDSDDMSGQSGNLPPGMQRFFKQFGQNGSPSAPSR